jgi:hypothetical protein
MTEIIAVSDIVEDNGKTVRENNAARGQLLVGSCSTRSRNSLCLASILRHRASSQRLQDL